MGHNNRHPPPPASKRTAPRAVSNLLSECFARVNGRQSYGGYGIYMLGGGRMLRVRRWIYTNLHNTLRRVRRGVSMRKVYTYSLLYVYIYLQLELASREHCANPTSLTATIELKRKTYSIDCTCCTLNIKKTTNIIFVHQSPRIYATN